MYHEKIDTRLFVYLTLAFIVAAVIGTLSHEGGHYLAARLYGYNAKIHYAYTITYYGQAYSPQKNLAITAAGPLQSMTTGTIGFVLLLIFKRHFKQTTRLKPWQWIVILTALFWLRAPADFFIWNISPFFSDFF